MTKFRLLKAEEVDARVGTCSEKGFSLLLYKDARVDMELLDEVVGAENWQRRHYAVKDNMYCSVGIWSNEKKEWVWKDDCGVESNTAKEKGEASDSFKRACVNWGIGRELYTAPYIYINGHTKKNDKGKMEPEYKSIKVTVLDYVNGEISKLQIKGDKEVIYEYGMKGTAKKTELKPQDFDTTPPAQSVSKATNNYVDMDIINDIWYYAQEAQQSEENVLKWVKIKFKKAKVEDLNIPEANELIKVLRDKAEAIHND